MNLSFLKRFLAERKKYARVYDELMSCNDRELRELGLERADIPRLADLAAREGSL